tara:strand:- start:255 stop:614 length:360 start_codon:yes stop_codon:yes gene_type:complete
MTQPKNMAYWRAKNNCKADGSFDGNLKNKRSPMRQDSGQEKKDERLGKGVFNKPADEKKKEESSPAKLTFPEEPTFNPPGMMAGIPKQNIDISNVPPPKSKTKLKSKNKLIPRGFKKLK